MFIDTHCHLNLDQFADSYKEAVENALAHNVKAIINVGANLASSERAVAMSREFESGIYAAVGMHPTDAVEENYDEAKMFDLINHPKVVAVGEIGLDYAATDVDKKEQLELFNNQIRLALRAKKPVIIHCRDAYDDLISALMALSEAPQGVIHCYVGDWAHAQVFLEMGFYLSFTGIITFSKSTDLQKVVENVPLDKIMVETDAPWLAPEPYRGKQNEPAYVVEVAKKIAEIKKISLAEVETQTTQNAQNLFKLK